MTTLQPRKLFEVIFENKQTTDGVSGCACDWILSSYDPWLGLWVNLLHLFYYSTYYYYIQMHVGTVLNCTVYMNCFELIT